MRMVSGAWIASAIAGVSLIVSISASATTTCTWTDTGTVRKLNNDCTTDQTLGIPDGFTFDGNGFQITALDPAGDHFRGAVLANLGTTANVIDVLITAELGNTCDANADRLRGIMFEGASGSISHSTVVNLNQGASGCQEGNAIEVRNAPFDGTHPNTQSVEIAHVIVDAYQKTGIVCNGDVTCNIHHNSIGNSATQDNLAANAVQVGFGATGSVVQNHISANQWRGTSDWAATGILVYLAADGVEVSLNNVDGNGDVGLYFEANGGTVDNNRIFERGDDAPPYYDIGLGNWGIDNTVTNNKVRGYEVPTDGDATGTKAIPSPQDPTACLQTCD